MHRQSTTLKGANPTAYERWPNCTTTGPYTSCYASPPLSSYPGPPPGYTTNPNFLRKYTCRLNNFTHPEKCEPYAAEDFNYVPVAAPVAAAPPTPQQSPAAPPSWLVGPCTFKLGFAALHDAMPDVVGDCGENEHWNTSNGDSVQKTARGLLVWRKADNFTAFTDGYRSWVSGPFGVQQRLNTECFAWESGCPR